MTKDEQELAHEEALDKLAHEVDEHFGKVVVTRDSRIWLLEFTERFLAEIRKTQEPVAIVIAGTEYDGDLKLINKREIDWYPDAIEHLPVDTPLYTLPTIPPHLALVPREPTAEMKAVIRNEYGAYDSEAELYKAMLTAWEKQS